MADSQDTQSIDETAAPAPGGIKARLPLMAAIIAGLAVGVGTGAVVVGPAAARALGFGATVASDSSSTEEGDEHAEGDSSAAGTAPVVHTLENLVLNPAASGGTRFLMVTLTMECANSAGVSMLRERDPELRDIVLSTLGRKTVDELTAVSARDSIKTELVGALNERFGKNTVVRVYFPQYVVQ